MRLNAVAYDINEHSILFMRNGTLTKVLCFNPNIKFYSPEHIVYLIIPLTVLFFLGFCPALLLCLYPTQLFKRVTLQCCSARKRIALSVFAETFQGCYKDGLNGTRDYRVTPATIMFLSMIWTLSLIMKESNSTDYSILISAVLMVTHYVTLCTTMQVLANESLTQFSLHNSCLALFSL